MCVSIYKLNWFQNVLHQWDISFMLWSCDQKISIFLVTWWNLYIIINLDSSFLWTNSRGFALTDKITWTLGPYVLFLFFFFTSFFNLLTSPLFFAHPLGKDTELFITVRISINNIVPLLGGTMTELVKFNLWQCQKKKYKEV